MDDPVCVVLYLLFSALCYSDLICLFTKEPSTCPKKSYIFAFLSVMYVLHKPKLWIWQKFTIFLRSSVCELKILFFFVKKKAWIEPCSVRVCVAGVSFWVFADRARVQWEGLKFGGLKRSGAFPVRLH